MRSLSYILPQCLAKALSGVCRGSHIYASRTGWLLFFATVCALAATPEAQARMGLIVGEPFGSFGTAMPQGHASVYLSDLCVETPIQLRPCRAGEMGAVVSRYHDLRHPDRDWMAFPLPVFLYGLAEDGAYAAGLQSVMTTQLPFMTAGREADMRARYWHRYLAEYIPGTTDKGGHPRPPAYGDWEEGIGAAFDRRLLMYNFNTTAAQDTAVLAWLNDRPNRRSYTLTRHNCADFAADLLRLALPAATIHRNVPADFDMTTPKQLAREVDGYGLLHPELHLAVYEVPQLPGAMRRSRPIRGAAESLLTTKRYMAALLILQPEIILAAWIDYERCGKWSLGQDAVAVTPSFWGRSSQSSHPEIVVAGDASQPADNLHSRPPAMETGVLQSPVFQLPAFQPSAFQPSAEGDVAGSYSSGFPEASAPSTGLRAKW